MAADQGYAMGQCNIGLYFKNGKGIDQSNHQAFHYFKLAADQGLALGQYYVGACFKTGTGIEQSDEKAFKYFQLAADQGYAKAQYQVGKLFYEGKGIQQSSKKALDYFKLASKQGFAKAKKFITENEMSEIKKMADQGDADDQIQMGEWYQIKKSLIEACKYYRLAADQGKKQIQYKAARAIEQMGYDIEGSWELAIYYYKMAAIQGHLLSIRRLFSYYHYGQGVEESQEEALKYLRLGIQLNDPECQYQLGRYHENGWGNLIPSLVESFKYYKLAAKQGHQQAIKSLRPRILHPDAQEVNIQSYLQDLNISTLEVILKGYGNQPIFLEKHSFSSEEAQVICAAMIENPRFTFMCSKYDEISSLILVFELAGYSEEDLNFSKLVNPSTQEETYGCVFVGHDVKDNLLYFGSLEDDPQRAKEMHLETLAEIERKENRIKAYKIYQTLPNCEIKYPGSQEIDISNYLSDNNIDTLKTILSLFENSPAHLYMTRTSYEEIMAIREAMINNPRLCFLCNDWESQIDLEEAFYHAGYRRCLKKKKEVKDGQKFYGYLFKGKNY